MTDKEYIEREELYKQVLSAYVTAERFGFELGKEVVLLAIKQQPAADVVEVVRCGECQHYNAGFECLIEGYGIERPNNYFCADGKRKNGEQE